MVSSKLTHELSLEADHDLSDIFDFSVEKFGIDQAIKYLNRFEDIFENLCHNPETGRKRNEIRIGLRSISMESHTVFYRIIENRIRIVRVLYASRDIIKFLRQD